MSLGSRLLFLREYRTRARAYWLPRKINSSSCSRMACWRQVGNRADIPTAMMAMTMSSTTIVKPSASNREQGRADRHLTFRQS